MISKSNHRFIVAATALTALALSSCGATDDTEARPEANAAQVGEPIPPVDVPFDPGPEWDQVGQDIAEARVADGQESIVEKESFAPVESEPIDVNTAGEYVIVAKAVVEGDLAEGELPNVTFPPGLENHFTFDIDPPVVSKDGTRIEVVLRVTEFKSGVSGLTVWLH